MSVTGQCLCGTVSYKVNGDPQMSLVCHCRNCQRQAGTAFSTLLGVAKQDFELTGAEPKLYVDNASTSGNPVNRYFCANCGSPLYSSLGAYPDTIFLKAGTLDDVSGFAPAMHIWCDSKQPWVTLDDGVTQIGTQLDVA